MKTIEILVSPEGISKMETRGFVGESCRDATRFLEQALGQCSQELLTAEFHQAVPSAQCLHRQQP